MIGIEESLPEAPIFQCSPIPGNIEVKNPQAARLGASWDPRYGVK